MMTKKDFVLIASALREAYSECTGPLERKGVVIASNALARDLKLNNPRFDKDTFITATLPKEEL